MIFTVLNIVIMLYSLVRFKKGFLLFLIFQVLYFPDAQLIRAPGLGSVNINLAMALFFITLYFIKKKKIVRVKRPFPYTIPMVIIGCSLIFSCFTAVAGFGTEFVKAIGLILIDFFMVYVIWQVVETKEDFGFIYVGITILVAFAYIYGIYEYQTQLNPILDYKLSLTENKLRTYKMQMQWDLRGYRMYFFFEHPISAAMTFALYLVTTMTCTIRFKDKLPNKTLVFVLCLLCVPYLFLTKMRSGFVFLMISVLAFVDFSSKRFRRWAMFVLFVMLAFCFTPIVQDNVNLVLSMFDENAQIAVSGSSFEMRLDQLNAVYNLMKMSPLFGLGEKFALYISNQYTARALAYESLWFEQMARHGMVGVLSYIIMIYFSVIKVPQKYKDKSIAFVSLAYWVVYTMTSLPYFRIYLYYLVLFYFIKRTPVYYKGNTLSR